LVVTVPNIGPVPVLVKFQRGFVGADAVVRGKPYRFVNTHLETRLEEFGPQGRFYQSAQAAELLLTLSLFPTEPGQTTLVVGDMNSDPRDEIYPSVPPEYPPIVAVPPYLQFTQLARFTDVWTRQPAAAKGKGAPLGSFTCCQWEDLSNFRSDLYERIDLIFSATPPRKVPEAKLLGESIGDKTLPKGKGLWPSDHASVAAKILY
jgi:endonuclease/exonuclease/phosphatase family metal-dependent hydrolase